MADMSDATADSRDQLKSIIERIDRIHKQKDNDLRELYLEAKALGFNRKAIRAVMIARKMPPGEYKALQDDIELYLAALGARPGPEGKKRDPHGASEFILKGDIGAGIDNPV